MKGSTGTYIGRTRTVEILTDPLTWLVTLARQLSSVASMVQLHSIALIFSHVACSPTYESKLG